MLRKMLHLPDPIHCLFLSQFDTEHAFRQDLRWDPRVLLMNFTGDFYFLWGFGVRWGESFREGNTEAIFLQEFLQRATGSEITPCSVSF